MSSSPSPQPKDSPAKDQLIEQPAVAPPALPPPPDGGLTAWLQVLGSFFLWFSAWGLVNSFGVFQAYYERTGLRDESSSRISWIGSLQLCLFIIGTVVVGPLYDLGYLRALLLTGGFLVVFGMMMTSICKQYWQFILAQGVVTGLGMTCLFVPSIALIPPYFVKKRALATGIAATGSSIGAIIFAVVFQQLLPKVGFGWATRIIAFILLAVMIPPVFVLKKRIPHAPARDIIDPQALREAPFDITLIATIVVFIGLYIPFFYVQIFSIQDRIMNQSSLNLNNYLVIILNAGSFFGRLAPNIAADRIGPFNTIIPCTIIAGALGFAWIGVTDRAGIIAFAVFYGFFSGSFVALTPVLWASLCPNLKVLGTRTGMFTVPMAIGLLIGNPIAGSLVNGTNYRNLQIFCGSTVLGAAVFISLARLAKTGPRLFAKA